MTDGPGFAARTDVGLQRTDNEDRFLARSPLFAVADGMGGHLAGEVASQLVITTLAETTETTPVPTSDEVVEAIERSNLQIRSEARQNAEMAGMGTTCTTLVIGDRVRIAHVGDSRAYRFRQGLLEQLTDDHSLVATMVREGLLAPDAAKTDGRRNIVTRALGAEDVIRVDRIDIDVAPGDRLILSTDGLHGQVDDATIAAVLAEATTVGDAADRLVRLANGAGGDDNVTVIVIDVDLLPGGAVIEDAQDVSAEPTGPRRDRRLLRWVVAILVAALVLAVVAGILMVAATRFGR